MIGAYGAAVLDTEAEPYELALADVEASHLLALDAEAIVRQWNPHEVPARNLKVLAFAMGVTLWDDAWPELTKRQWIADQWLFKAKRGTEFAIRMALALWGYSLVEVLTPPQGFYLSAEFTAAERDAWISRMPQLRIRLGAVKGVGHIGEWFLGDGFLGEAALMPNDGARLYGRRGFLRRDGVDYPLEAETLTKIQTQDRVVDVNRISTAGLSTVGWFLGEDALGEDGLYLGSAEVEAELITVRLERTLDREQVILGLTTTKPGLEPLDTRYQRISDVGNGGGGLFLGADHLGDAALTEDDAGTLMADVLFLNDPAISAPMLEGASFLGVDRLSMDAHTAELMIDLHLKAEADALFLGQGFLGEGFTIREDTAPRENAFRAVMAAKALRDTVLVSFEAKRPLQFSDPIAPDVKAGDWVPNRL